MYAYNIAWLFLSNIIKYTCEISNFSIKNLQPKIGRQKKIQPIRKKNNIFNH